MPTQLEEIDATLSLHTPQTWASFITTATTLLKASSIPLRDPHLESKIQITLHGVQLDFLDFDVDGVNPRIEDECPGELLPRIYSGPQSVAYLTKLRVLLEVLRGKVCAREIFEGEVGGGREEKGEKSREDGEQDLEEWEVGVEKSVSELGGEDQGKKRVSDGERRSDKTISNVEDKAFLDQEVGGGEEPNSNAEDKALSDEEVVAGGEKSVSDGEVGSDKSVSDAEEKVLSGQQPGSDKTISNPEDKALSDQSVTGEEGTLQQTGVEESFEALSVSQPVVDTSASAPATQPAVSRPGPRIVFGSDLVLRERWLDLKLQFRQRQRDGWRELDLERQERQREMYRDSRKQLFDYTRKLEGEFHAVESERVVALHEEFKEKERVECERLRGEYRREWDEVKRVRKGERAKERERRAKEREGVVEGGEGGGGETGTEIETATETETESETEKDSETEETKEEE